MRNLTRGAVAGLAALALAGCHRPRPPEPRWQPAHHQLVVFIVIDQLPSWGFEARQDLYQHGLRRLIREGVVFPRVAYPYAITMTAPGHATLATGAPPAVTGIVANSWYRRAEDKEYNAEWDPETGALALPGRDPAAVARVEGASGRPLRVDGIADALEAATGGASHTVTIGGKPRAACFVAGRKPDVALWYEPALVGMTSSRYYGEALPAWVIALDAAHPIAPYLDQVWTAGDPAMLARRTGIADDAPGEGGEYGIGVSFPHALATTENPAKALRATPFLDTIETDAAIAAIDGESLGQDRVMDLLAVSYSAHDYAGHNWGQESWEMIELERHLDAEIGRLLDALDAKVGADNYAVVLTSDHGMTRLIERGAPAGARRIPPKEIEDTAEGAAAAVVGPGDWIAAVSSGMIYVRPALAAGSPALREAALAAIAAAVERVPQVAYAVRLDLLPAGCHGLDDLRTRVCLSRVTAREAGGADETGELLVVPTAGSLVTTYATGSSHDPISADDELVPVIVRIPGAFTRTADPHPSSLSIAPTLADLLGVRPPAAATAEPLVRVDRSWTDL